MKRQYLIAAAMALVGLGIWFGTKGAEPGALPWEEEQGIQAGIAIFAVGFSWLAVTHLRIWFDRE